MYVGIDIGGTKCAVVSAGADGAIREKIRFATAGREETLSRIFQAVELLKPTKAIGVSCGGPLDEEKGLILAPPNLPDWDGVPMTQMLTARFSLPAKLRNDANACALAEWRLGAGRGTKNMIFLTCGTGLGAGLILDGRLYSGKGGNAGEIGHVRLAPDGPSGYGKRGSAEGFCSGPGIREVGRAFARESLQRGEVPLFLAEHTVETFDIADLAGAARAGDGTALRVFDFCGRKLGRALALLCDLLDPEMILLGSVYARCRDLLEGPALEEMRREALPMTGSCTVTVPLFGENIGDMAALAVAMEAYDESR